VDINSDTSQKEREMEYWSVNFNGPLQLQGVGVGILVTSPKGEISCMSCKCIFSIKQCSQV
jgi:hypothetical protein